MFESGNVGLKKNIDEAKELLDNKKETVINAYRNWDGAANEWNR
ncbi:hypothetical protein [Mesonia phycicola]|nr:hypothetical protein [Mesonia phycicola]